jgi:hypothetical protein
MAAVVNNVFLGHNPDDCAVDLFVNKLLGEPGYQETSCMKKKIGTAGISG